MMTRLRLAAFLLLLASVLALGCGGTPRISTTKVTGVVTYKSTPVEGATVTFVSTEPGGKPASAVTDSKGAFSLKTFVAADYQPTGAVAGDYEVMVTKIAAGSAPSPDEMMKQMTSGGGGPNSPVIKPPENSLPARYADPKQSGFKHTVKAGSPLDVKLDLVD